MLKIRLYEGVKLNNKYEEVFSLGKNGTDTLSTLEKYLALKSSTYFAVDTTYYENEGTLVLDEKYADKSIYNYNYMKIISEDELGTIKYIRYCFINDILIKNGCVYIDYVEDIWSSYADGIVNCINSFLNATRIRNYTSLTPKILKIPVNYDGNNPLQLIDIRDATTQNKYYVIAELQVYYLESAGSAKVARTVGYGILSDFEVIEISGVRNINPTNYKFTYSQALEKIKTIVSMQPDMGRCVHRRDIVPMGTYEQMHYEIGNIYIISNLFNIVPTFVSGVNGFQIYEMNITDPPTVPSFFFFDVNCLGNEGTLISIFNYTFNDNYKDIAFGNLEHQVKLVHNGTQHVAIVYLIFSSTELSIILNVDNQLIDITNSYYYEIPYNVISSEELSQRRIAYSQKRYNNMFSMINNVRTIASGNFDIMQGSGEIIASAYGGGNINKDGQTKSKYGGMISGADRVREGREEIYSGILGLYKNKINQILMDSAIYSNAKGVFNSDNNLINCLYGLFFTRINPDNENYVIKAINKYGYETFEFISDISVLGLNNTTVHRTAGINYNVIRFVDCNLYGKFPKFIASILEEILNKGVKIWYIETELEDNYVV